jgi:hypothetical protein
MVKCTSLTHSNLKRKQSRLRWFTMPRSSSSENSKTMETGSIDTPPPSKWTPFREHPSSSQKRGIENVSGCTRPDNKVRREHPHNLGHGHVHRRWTWTWSPPTDERLSARRTIFRVSYTRVYHQKIVNNSQATTRWHVHWTQLITPKFRDTLEPKITSELESFSASFWCLPTLIDESFKIKLTIIQWGQEIWSRISKKI